MRRVLAAAVVVALASGAVILDSASAESVTASSSATPLIVLMDVSGSMSESVASLDGSGSVVKLEAAKRALQEPIRNQPPGARVGIWTYPSGSNSSGGCSTGSWLVDVSSTSTPTAILNSIASLTADGGTPTGPALSALVAELKSQGISSANIVVVSDGLYGCGPDPCEVAKDLNGTGFTLTIQAVGFDITKAGRDSLTCMAEATGGNYFDAGDGDELSRVISQLTTPEFTLTITGVDRPTAGKPTTIRASLTNVSAFDAHDVKLRLSFSTAQPDLLVPRVTPTLISVGGVPAGKSVTRQWTFVAGQAGTHKKAVYSVSASSLETLPVQSGGSFTTTVPGNEAKDAGSILADLITKKQSLVILGDSFSSGEGTFEYLPGLGGVDAKCHRSPDTYLARTFTAAGTRVEILACSGAVSANLLGSQLDGDSGITLARSQVAQLSELGSVPGAVVMTVGGNDMGFKGIIEQCVTPGSTCASPQSYVNDVLARPAQLRAPLVRAYEDAWLALNQPKFVAARGGAYAPVIVLAYPKLVREDPLNACPINVFGTTGGFDINEVKFTKRLSTELNDAIEGAVGQARADGFEVYFVNETESAFLSDHTLCAPDDSRWVNRVLLVGKNPKSESVHPMVDGYTAETEAILGWSTEVDRTSPSKDAKSAAAKTSGLLDFLNAPVEPSTAVAADTTGATTSVVHPGQSMLVTVSGLGTAPATVSLHSTPQLLTTAVPDKDGTLRVFVSLPADVAPGFHELVVQGWDPQGALVTSIARIEVAPPTPLWVLLIGIASILLVAAAVTLLLIWRRRVKSSTIPESA